MIQEYPLNIDIFSLIIFLGTVQGLFLSYFLLNKNNRSVKANVFLGILLIASSILCLDILFSYTNFMFKVIYLVDASEPLNFVVGPAFFLYIISKIDESKLRKPFYHFIPAIVYFLYSILFHVRSIESKYNAYLDQYHPELEFVNDPSGSFSDPLLFKTFVNELTMISIAIYLILSIYILYKAEKMKDERRELRKLYNILWIDILLMGVILFLLIFVKTYFQHDLGDYIIIVAICVFIYSISFKVIRQSLFFNQAKYEAKYSKSVLDEESKVKILDKLNSIMDEKYYLNSNPSLPDLAKKVNTSPNYLSQVINEKLGLTFLELINKYRIEEAKKMLLDETLSETVEGIAYTVGFNSKSTFHSAFKKFTGQTPSEFRTSKT